ALQVDGLQAHKNNAAFWQEMYGHYRTVCANTQSLLGDVSAFAVLFQANEDTSNWSPENVAQIVQFCRQVPQSPKPPEPSEAPEPVETVDPAPEPVGTVDPAPELEHTKPGHDVVSEDTYAQDDTADDSDNEIKDVDEHPILEPESDPEPEQLEESEQVDKSEQLDEPDQPAKKATAKEVSQQP